MLTRQDIDFLRSFRSQTHPVFSVYLNTDGKQVSKKEVETKLKQMARIVRLRLNGSVDKDFRREALQEIQKIEDYILNNYKEFTIKGMALFSSGGQNLWHEIELPRPPRNRFILDDSPYIRPLQFQEVEYRRVCTVVLDQHTARIFLIYQGTILEYKLVSDEVPTKVKWGGWAGYDEKRTSRKHAQKVNEHFEHVADTLFELFKRDHFDWLIIGCKTEYLKEFESCLHNYLRDRVVDHQELPVDAPEHEILQRSMKVEQTKTFEEHCALVERVMHTSQAGGLAAIGLENVLRHLNGSAVDTLLVARDYVAGGVRCLNCTFLGILEKSCSLCGGETVEVDDIVTEAIDRSLDQSVSVKQIFEGVGMDRAQNMAAFLRFRI